MCLDFHNSSYRRTKQREEDSSKSKSSTSTAPLQLQQFQQQQQQPNARVYDPLHDCYTPWIHRLELHCSLLQVSNSDTLADDGDDAKNSSSSSVDGKFLEQDPSTTDVPSRIASLDNTTEPKDFTAEVQQLAQHLVGLSQDAQSNYAAGVCFDACIPRLLYFRRQKSETNGEDERFWEEMPDVSLEHVVCEASLSDLFAVVHEAFLRPHGVHGDDTYVHFLWKIFPQRSVVRNYETMVKEHFFDNAESRWLIDRLLLCSLLGAYRHADPIGRPPAAVRLQLYDMLHRERRFYSQRYTRDNTHYLQWQLKHERDAVDADVVDAFISGLLQHCREVIMFAVREFLVYCIDDDPAMLQAARKMFNYDKFRETVVSTTNKIRAYVSKHANGTSADATMTAAKLIAHHRHVHPHSHDAVDVEQTEQETKQTAEEPAAKRHKRSRGVAATRRGKLKTGRIAMTCYEWDLATIVKAPTTQLRGFSFQKPTDPITKAFDAVRNQIRRQVPWDKYNLLPVRMFLNDKELMQIRDERQISYHSHDPPADMPIAQSEQQHLDAAAFFETGEKKQRRGDKDGILDDDRCSMNWQQFDAQLQQCRQKFLSPLHPSSVESKELKSWPWQSASAWQTLLDQQMESSVTQIYVTDTQMTARHSFVLYEWLTQHTESTTPTVDMWNAFVSASPAFGVKLAAQTRLRKITQKYYPYQFTKDSWLFTINRFADQFPYAYAVVQTFVYMWKTISTLAVHKLPLNYRIQQASAIHETAIKQLPAFSTVSGGNGGALCVPSEMADLWFCSVCGTLYSLLDDPNSPYKHQYRLGLREAIFDFESDEAYCNRTVTNMHMHCQAQPLIRLPMLERLVQFRKMHLMLCPACGVMMVFSPGDCCFVPGKGFACSACSAEWSRSLIMQINNDGDSGEVKSVAHVVMQQADKCYLCNTVTNKLWYYGPQTCLCRRHHKPSLVRFIMQQSTMAEQEDARLDVLSDSRWIRQMIHKFKDDYMARTAQARKKYNNAVKRRIRQYRGMNERR